MYHIPVKYSSRDSRWNDKRMDLMQEIKMGGLRDGAI
jgi:hypothetical protein